MPSLFGRFLGITFMGTGIVLLVYAISGFMSADFVSATTEVLIGISLLKLGLVTLGKRQNQALHLVALIMFIASEATWFGFFVYLFRFIHTYQQVIAYFEFIAVGLIPPFLFFNAQQALRPKNAKK